MTDLLEVIVTTTDDVVEIVDEEIADVSGTDDVEVTEVTATETAEIVDTSSVELVEAGGAPGLPGPAGATGATGPQGPAGPSGSGTGSYRHVQSAPAAVWTIVHNLGFRPNWFVVDSAGGHAEGLVVHDSVDQTTISFFAAGAPVAFAGEAYGS